MSPSAPGAPGARLHFIVGKGGVGKTTVAAAMALALARRGCRTLAVEMDTAGRLPALFGHSGAAPQPVAVGPDLHVLTVDGRAALEEYLGLIIPVKRLLQTIFSSGVYQYFVAAAPGLKELMTVGKIWYEATRQENGRAAWDAIVVDAPATGHSLQVLRMPQAARDTFAAGLVQREAAKIVDFLRDPETTAVHLVTVAEEMPVAEAIESRAELMDRLGLPLGYVIVNRLHQREFSELLVARLADAAGRLRGREAALLSAVQARAAEEGSWSTINRQHLDRLVRECPTGSVVTLPYLFVEEFDAAALGRLSAMLDSSLSPRVAARRQS